MYQEFKRVLIIEPQTDAGRLLRDVVKELGAVEAVITESVKDAWAYLQTADNIPDWILSVPDPNPKFNVIHLLQLLSQHQEFSTCRISLVVTDEQKDILSIAFDLGLLSYHKKPFTKITLKSEFETMLNNLSLDKDQHYAVAAEYLRNFLNEKEDFERRISLERSLVAKFPKATKHYLALAEAQILANKPEDARKTLSIAKHLGADMTIGVKQLNDLLDPMQGGEASLADSFNIKSALIIDSDETAAKAVESCLTQIGVKEVNMVADGNAALEFLKTKGEPSVLISEWKIPKLSGPALVQRIRQMGMIGLPIMIQSSLLKDKDKNLLKEIGVASIINKPVKAELLISELVNVFQNERLANTAQDMERKIRQLLAANKTKEAEELYEEFAKQTGVPAGTRMLVEATVKFHAGKCEEARDLALASLKEKGEAVITLNLLSKIFLKLNDRESALKCLNRAQEFSSDNLERLVMMAEAHSDSGSTEEAQKAIDEAKKIDAANDMVVQAEAELAITKGDSSAAKNILGEMESAMNLIANMNNRAVLLVNGGEEDKGISLYKNALESLPPKMNAERDIITYNFSLAYARANKPKDAKAFLEKIVSSSDNKAMVAKAKALLTRVDAAIASQQAIKLNVAPKKEVVEVKASLVRPVALHLRPGQLCLHGVFDASDLFNEPIRKVVDSLPAFSRQKLATLTREKKAS